MSQIRNHRVSFIILLAFLFILWAETACNSPNRKRGDIRVMFYNVENLFDTENDSLAHDGEFTPDGAKHWTGKRYWKKINDLYKVIAATGQERPPEIIGLCEVENKGVLIDLVRNTPLSKYNYEVVHHDSKDFRGIDVTFLYRRDLLTKLEDDFISVRLPDNPNWTTRDIAYLQLLVNDTDTLHLFANHWPSRLGGQKKSEPKRIQAAITLRNRIDSIQTIYDCPKILIMGDFNDEPQDNSLMYVLGDTSGSIKQATCEQVTNLSSALKADCRCGTYKYRADWNMLDQMLVTGSLLKTEGLHTCNSCLSIVNNSFLVEDDEKFGGVKPARTYAGPRYLGGYSDHFPIYLDFWIK